MAAVSQFSPQAYSNVASVPSTDLRKLMAKGMLWRGRDERNQSHHAYVSTGIEALDSHLQGGWQWQKVHEIQVARPFSGELTLLRPALKVCAQQKRPVFWISPPALPFAPSLAFPELPQAQHLVVQPQSEVDALWSIEHILQSGAAGMVMFWHHHVSQSACRRLHLACQNSGALCVVISSPQNQEARPYCTRVLLDPEGQRIDILKRSGGWPVQLALPKPLFWKRTLVPH